MKECCVHTFRWIKTELTVEVCVSRQLHSCPTHISTAIVVLATLRGDAGKLSRQSVIIGVMCTSETHF